MAWYRTGTVTVTNGSATVVGAGTDFVSNVAMGDGFRGPDGRTSEIARVVSATELTLAEGYNGPSAAGQPFAIQPTQSYIRDLAQSAATLLATFVAVRDGIGQGLIADGSPAAPGIRFAADQDTGIRRAGTNAIGLVAGGVQRFSIDADGGLTLTNDPEFVLRITPPAPGTGVSTSKGRLGMYYGTTENAAIDFIRDADGVLGVLALRTSGVERARIDALGNFFVGTSVGSCHTFDKAGAQGTLQFRVQSSQLGTAPFSIFAANTNGFNGGQFTVVAIANNTVTGRSLSAGGTLNASGADYAEYMAKAAGCGTIAAGDACGVDADGRLTRTWADAVSFVVKSTDPAYVGGDTWAAHLAPRPEAPGEEPVEPNAPPARPDDDAELDAWREIVDAYPGKLAAWRAAHAAWQAATATYEHDLPVWEAALEAERVKVDRIAFCGQVPVNVTGDFAVGDYLIAAPAGAGIKAVAIAAGDITFDQYRRRLGRVWAVRDGRAWIDVQHG